MDYLEIGGKKRPFVLGFYAIEKIAEKRNLTKLTEVLSAFNADVKDIPSMFTAALENGAIEAGKDIDFTEEEVKKWLNLSVIQQGLSLITKAINSKN